MNKYCSKCGSELKDGVKFCEMCGAPVGGGTNSNASIGPAETVVNRNIGLCLVLSLVTCGIYSLIWLVFINDDVNKVNDDINGTSGVLVLLFTLLTCGIYGIYWNYKMGQKLYEAGGKYGKNINDNSIVYLVLSIFGLSVVSYCLMQNDLNQFS